jgi:hypothetical protein
MPTSTSKKHKKDKSKKSKPLLTETAPEGSATNEGLDLNWAYQPPPDVKAITANEDNGEFDWDAVKEDDDVEVWVIRLPDNVRYTSTSFEIRLGQEIVTNASALLCGLFIYPFVLG